MFVVSGLWQGDKGLQGVPGPVGPPGTGLIGPKVSDWTVLLYLKNQFPDMTCFVFSTFTFNSLYFQGSIGKSGPQGPPGIQGEGIQGQKVSKGNN